MTAYVVLAAKYSELQQSTEHPFFVNETVYFVQKAKCHRQSFSKNTIT